MLVKRIQQALNGKIALIPVGKNQFAIVDPEDYERLSRYRWRLRKSHSCYYAVRKTRINGKTIYIRMHREVMGFPEGKDVHHDGRNTLDNRKKKLIVSTKAEHHRLHNEGL